jgi:4-oxalocrotonate tautomerase
MPFIQVNIVEGVLSSDKKRELIAALTDAVAKVGGEGFRPMTRCIIQEVKSGDWGVAGRTLTTADATPATPGGISRA